MNFIMQHRLSCLIKDFCLFAGRSLVVFIVLAACAAASSAREEPAGEVGMGEIIERWVNIAHYSISNRIVQTSERFDQFFGDERVKEEQKATQLIVTPTVTISEGEQIEFSCPLTFNIALPHMKKRWNLMVEALLKEEDTAEGEDADEDVDGNDVSVRLRYKILQEAKRWLSFDAGVKFQTDNVLKPFGKVRFRRIFDLDPWALRIIQVVSWIEDDGWGESSQFDIDHNFGKDLLFRISNQALWSENKDGLEFSQTHTLRWQLSGRRALGLELVGKGATQPLLTMNEYKASVIFRRRLYKNWVFSEIEPGIRMLREDDFEAASFVMVNLECTFGEVSAK